MPGHRARIQGLAADCSDRGVQSAYGGNRQTFSDGRMEVSDRSVVGQCKPLPDDGPHYPVHSYQLADCCLPESHVVIQLREGYGLQDEEPLLSSS